MQPLNDDQRKLVQDNVGLARLAVHRAHIPKHLRDDALQEALYGLMHASTKYQPSKSKFTTYGYFWAHQFVSRFKKLGGTATVPRSKTAVSNANIELVKDKDDSIESRLVDDSWLRAGDKDAAVALLREARTQLMRRAKIKIRARDRHLSKGKIVDAFLSNKIGMSYEELAEGRGCSRQAVSLLMRRVLPAWEQWVGEIREEANAV